MVLTPARYRHPDACTPAKRYITVKRKSIQECVNPIFRERAHCTCHPEHAANAPKTSVWAEETSTYDPADDPLATLQPRTAEWGPSCPKGSAVERRQDIATASTAAIAAIAAALGACIATAARTGIVDTHA